jgi:hypothetical protein
MTDPVNHPPHYKAGGIETIDFIAAKLGQAAFVEYCRGNAIKYLARAGLKGDPAQDARKAEWYARRMAEAIEHGAAVHPDFDLPQLLGEPEPLL